MGPPDVAARVHLRLPAPRDEAEFVALRRASRAHLEPWEPEPPDGHDPWGPEEFERYLDSVRSPRRVRWLIYRREDGALLGACAITGIQRGVLQSASDSRKQRLARVVLPILYWASPRLVHARASRRMFPTFLASSRPALRIRIPSRCLPMATKQVPMLILIRAGSTVAPSRSYRSSASR